MVRTYQATVHKELAYIEVAVEGLQRFTRVQLTANKYKNLTQRQTVYVQEL